MAKPLFSIKQYTLHPMGVHALRYSVVDLPVEQNALIICCNRHNQFTFSPCFTHVLEIVFPDYEDEHLPGAFNYAHARRIIRFITDLPDTVTDVYVCCAKGGSRSAAVAAALLRASGRSDMVVWRNPFYVPNKLVYRRLCREFELKTNRFSTWIRMRLNNRAFRKAQKNKGSTPYERWQILD